MLERPRSSRIFYGRKFFAYPLKPFEALMKLGVFRSIACVLSWLKARLFPVRDPRNFEDWVSEPIRPPAFQYFLQELYREGVGHALPRDLGRLGGAADQGTVVRQRHPATPSSRSDSRATRSKVIKTLINSFRYPRKGPGMMWEAARKRRNALGGDLRMGCRVGGCEYDDLTERWTLQFIDRRRQRAHASRPST